MNILETTTSSSPNNKSEECARFTIDTTNQPFTFSNITTVNNTYTMTFYVKSDASGKIRVGNKALDTTTSWKKFLYTFVASSTNLELFFDIAGTYYLYHTQLESGNKSTDYSPDPEDANDRLKSAEAKIEMQSDEIELSVKKDGIIASINLSEEEIKIQAEKIELSGYATFVDLENTNSKTVIHGGNILADSITSAQLATDSLKSRNYVEGSTGSFWNLADGTFDSKNTKISADGTITAINGVFSGEINADSGMIGHWNIENPAIWKGSNVFGNASGMYFGDEGLSITDNFTVTKDGQVHITSYMSKDDIIANGIAGLNYIQDTRLMKNYTTGGTAKIVTGEDGFAIGSFAAPASLGWGNQVIALPPIKFSLLRNKKVTFSIWVRSDDYEAYNADTTHGLMVSFALCTAEATSRTKYHDQQFYGSKLSNTWKKLTLTTTLSDSWFGSGTGTIDSTTRFLLQIFNYSTYQLEFQKIKLEIGDTASEWSEALEDTGKTIHDLQTSIDMKIDPENLVSELNASADIIRFTGDRFIVDSTNLKISQNGTITTTNGIFNNITCNTGTIAGIKITSDCLRNETCGMSAKSTKYAFWAGESNSAYGSNDPDATVNSDALFAVTQNGKAIFQNRAGTYYTFIEDAEITLSGTSDEPRTYINRRNIRFFNQQYSSEYLISIGAIYDNDNFISSVGMLPSLDTNTDARQLKAHIGLSTRRWDDLYVKEIDSSGAVTMTGVANGTVQTYASNMYVGTSGRVWKTNNTSSRTIKHDIKALQDDHINAHNLYDVEIVQAKYNEDILNKNDYRYMQDLPMFIIEDLYEKYPMAVDKVSDDVKEWSWNAQYLIPPMLKLIQEQNERINKLEQLLEK